MAHIGTARNVERSGNRNELALSRSLRNIKGVRHLDIDMIQYNPFTLEPEIFFEACSGLFQYTPEQKCKFARKLAKHNNAWTMLVLHAYQDNNNEEPVTVWLWSPDGEKYEDCYGLEMTWEEQQDLCQQIHELEIETGEPL